MTRSDGRGIDKPPVLAVVEGRTDIEFLQRIAAVLRRSDASIPDISGIQQAGELVFVPCGGGDITSWTTRFAPLGLREFQLFDRESGIEAGHRESAVQRADQRPLVRAFLTSKRCIENFSFWLPAALSSQ